MQLRKCGFQSLNNMEFNNDAEMAFLQEIFHAMRSDGLKRASLNTLESMGVWLIQKDHV